MDTDFKDIVAAAQAVLRSVGAEVASPWFYLQFGLILAGAGIAFATNAADSRRVDMDMLATRWPLPVCGISCACWSQAPPPRCLRS